MMKIACCSNLPATRDYFPVRIRKFIDLLIPFGYAELCRFNIVVVKAVWIPVEIYPLLYSNFRYFHPTRKVPF